MSAQLYVGSFAKVAGVASQAVTGVGFTPKALVLWATSTTSGSFADVNAVIARGFDDGVNARGIGTHYLNGATAPVFFNILGVVTYSKTASIAIQALDPTPSIAVRGHVQSMDADGFTFTWTNSVAGFTGLNVNFLAIGGTGVSAKVGSAASVAMAVDQSFTGAGFKPTGVMLMAAISGSDTSWNGEFVHCNNFGWFNDQGCQGTATLRANSSGASLPDTTQIYQTTSACLAILYSLAGTLSGKASYKSMDADGFTLHWDIGTGGNYGIPWLALSGVGLDIGSFDLPASPNAARYKVTGLGMTPAGVLFNSLGVPTDTAIVNDTQGAISIGATDLTRQRVGWAGVKAGVDPTVSARYQASNACMIAATVASGASAIVGSMADVAAAAGEFTFAVTNATAVRRVLFCALGDRTSTPSTCPTEAAANPTSTELSLRANAATWKLKGLTLGYQVLPGVKRADDE
jgi:hypothetical protein